MSKSEGARLCKTPEPEDEIRRNFFSISLFWFHFKIFGKLRCIMSFLFVHIYLWSLPKSTEVSDETDQEPGMHGVLRKKTAVSRLKTAGCQPNKPDCVPNEATPTFKIAYILTRRCMRLCEYHFPHSYSYLIHISFGKFQQYRNIGLFCNIQKLKYLYRNM